MTTRTILHLDLDAFFCAVEIQRDPALDSIPFAVGGRPDQRGVVASCSYPARAFGVRSAMPMARAVQLCPQLTIVPHHFDLYRTASKAVMAILHDLTPLVEQLSIDEAFLDVTGLRSTPYTIARTLQKQINDDLGLPCSLGVSTNKLVAKIANNIGKSEAGKAIKGQTPRPPNAIKVIAAGGEAAFLAPLSVTELWGVGPKTAEQLHRRGVQTIGDIARLSPDELARMFGKNGLEISERARGIDTRPVVTEHEAKSISKETTFSVDVRDEATLKRVLRELSDGVGWRVRRSGLRGRTVFIKLRWSDFTTLSRQLTAAHTLDQDDEIYQAALRLFDQTWVAGKAVRLIGVGVTGFDQPGRQLSLWDDVEEFSVSEEARKLQSALDDIKSRFGEKMIKRGSQLRRGQNPDGDEE